MKTTVLTAILAATTVSITSGQEASKGEISSKPITTELSTMDKQFLRLRIERILEKDQQFRSYLSFGTTDEEELKRLKALDVKGQMAAMASKRSKLNPEIKTVLDQLQKKNDKENYAEFLEIVRKYGYPGPKRIGVEHDQLFVLLLHPPVPLEKIEDHVVEMKKLLLPEVKAGRMKAKMYATFIDNMRGKILRQPQLYGTNQRFDGKSGKILPPAISNLEATNRARQAIGLPALKDGEYQLVSK